jgi:DNA end-binding protein Ku
VAFPVEAFNARSESGREISFHQLHAKCHSRIHYQKTCPIHGAVGNDEIVSGYEISRGRYVEVEPEELDALRSDRERELTIDAFINPEDFDPLYHDGRMYYLSPAGDQAREPYAVLLTALRKQERWGIGQVVFSGQEQLVIVRPGESALQMAMLTYAAEIRDPEQTVAALPHVSAKDRNLRLAEQLIKSWSEDDFAIGKYEDEREVRLRELIGAKVSGKELVAAEAEDEPEVIT